MDVKVSRKELRLQPGSTGTEVLMSDIFDFYPIFSASDPNTIMDIEILDDPRTELLDRAMFAVIKQRGGDPLSLQDGSQWEESLLGEISVTTLLAQVHAAVLQEGPGVQSSFNTSLVNGKEYLSVSVSLTNSV